MKIKEIHTKISIFIVLLSSVYHVNAQSWQDPFNAVQLSDEFDQTKMQVTFYSENKDFCDYHVEISFQYTEGFVGMRKNISLTVSNGKRQILNYKVAEGARSYSYRYTYTMYRGNANKLPNSDFTYRLPVAEGDKLLSEVVENKFDYQLRFQVFTDTIYACRGGIICNDNLKDFTAKGHETFSNGRILSQVTVYHADGSFGEYVFQGKLLVYPGKIVKMGTPLAIINKNSYEASFVLFSTYFLDKNKVNDKTHGNKHTHFRPFFQTSNHGKIRLENDTNYFCEQTDEMFMQDMNKNQKKNYLKNKFKQFEDEK